MVMGVSDIDLTSEDQTTDYDAAYGQEPEPVEEPKAKPAKSEPKAKSATSAAAKGSRARAEARRVRRGHQRAAITRYVALTDTDPVVRAAMAALLGCDDDPVEIAVESLSGGAKSDQSIITDLVSLAGMDDDIDAMVEAAAFAEDKNRLRSAWSLMVAVGIADSTAPTKEPVTAAAALLLKTVRSADESSFATLSQAAEALSN